MCKGRLMKLYNIYEGILQILFPRRCPVCDEIVTPFGEKICLHCMPKLHYINPPRCLKCGKGIKEQEREFCHDCSERQHLYIRGRSLYEYRSAASGIYRLKYAGRQEYADFYGEEIALYLGDFIRQINPDGLIPIPMYPRKQRKRGYNQAEVLAKAVGREMGIPVYSNYLKRIKNTIPLKRLNPQERQNNLKKAFFMVRNDVKLKSVIVIDDIYTTGATIDEASSALTAGGVEQIYFITLACGAGL